MDEKIYDISFIKSFGEEYLGEFQRLLKAGANPDIRDEKGRTPLMGAAQSQDIQFVKALLEHGADVNAKDNDGTAALNYAGFDGIFQWHYCRKYKNLAETVMLLLANGAKTSKKNKEMMASFETEKGSPEYRVKAMAEFAGYVGYDNYSSFLANFKECIGR